MIIGRDLSNKIGLTLNFSTETIMWNDASVPMKDTTATAIESLHIDYPIGIDDMVGRIGGHKYWNILEAKYKKLDLHKEVLDYSPQLEHAQRKDLLKLLKRYKTLFDGTLGTCKDV